MQPLLTTKKKTEKQQQQQQQKKKQQPKFGTWKVQLPCTRYKLEVRSSDKYDAFSMTEGFISLSSYGCAYLRSLFDEEQRRLWPNKPIREWQSLEQLLHTKADVSGWVNAAAAFLLSLLSDQSLDSFASVVVEPVRTASAPGTAICGCLFPRVQANVSRL